MCKNKLIFKRPQINLARNTLLIYIVLVILTFVFHYNDLLTFKESTFIFSGIALPVIFVELLAARTFWRKFIFDSNTQTLYIEHFFLLFKYGKVEKMAFKDANVTVELKERRCYDGNIRVNGTFWCVYVDNCGQGRLLEDVLSGKFKEKEYPIENRLLKMCAEKTKNKILQFINQTV